MQQQKVVGDYLLTNKVLGSGNFAQVRLGQHRHTNQSVAVKVIDKTQLSKKMEKQLRFEVHLLRDVLRGHEGIVQLFDVVEEEDFVYLVMEHINGGDLFDFLMSRGGKLAPSIVRLLFIQMAQALRFCHDKGVVHHDLKLENLLIHLQHQQNDSQESDDEEEEENNQRLGNLFTVKVIDFGLAALCPSEDSQLSKFCGTESYCPPEILDGRRSYLGRKVDVYSLGVVLFALLTGSFPFCPDNVNLQWQQQTDFGFLSSLRFGSAASLEEQQLLREAKDLVLQLLNPNAKLRPSLQQVLEHPFVSSSTTSSSSRKQQQQSPCKRKRGGETLRSVSFPKEDLVFCFDEELSSTSGGEEEVKKQQKEQSNNNKWRDCLLLDESDWEEYEEEEEEDAAWWSYGSMDEERSFFVA